MKKIISIFILIFSLLLISNNCVFASGSSAGFIDLEKQTDAFIDPSGLNPTVSVGEVVANIIEIFLGFLGMVFLVYMVYAGFLWMNAQGNEDTVKKATSIIKNCIIGLIIVIAAYSITYFLFNALGNSGVGGGGGNPIETN